jgi:hypothetical protein
MSRISYFLLETTLNRYIQTTDVRLIDKVKKKMSSSMFGEENNYCDLNIEITMYG